jgi:hypothetical protein
MEKIIYWALLLIIITLILTAGRLAEKYREWQFMNLNRDPMQSWKKRKKNENRRNRRK